MLLLKRINTVVIIVSLILISILCLKVFSSTLKAEQLPTKSNKCANLLLVYARGSGQNPNHNLIDDPFNPDFSDVEKESAAFFSAFKTQLDANYPHLDYKAVSVHKFTEKGYSESGYKAVPVGTMLWVIPTPNTQNAEVSFLPGDYRDSVEQGINETVGYLKDQIATCPDQLIAVGGYSQGAQVMGESLFRLTEQERNKIVGVGLFGDPKFVASTGDNLLNPFDHYVSYPWRRGDATNNDRGMLDARLPYVPSDIQKRVASYCYRADLVCAGWSGVRGLKDVAHGGYAGTATNNTVNEIMQWAAPKLSQIERQKGGSIISDDESQAGMYPDSKARDIMILLNDDSNASVIDAFRYRLDKKLFPITLIHPNTTYGMKALEEADYIPHYSTVQSLLPYIGYDAGNAMFSVSNLQSAINKRYPFGNPNYGSGDLANPIGYAIEKVAFSTNWRTGTTKNLVVFTDRPLKEPYTYGLCSGNVQQSPQGYPSLPCQSYLIDTTPQPKTLFPEICATAFQAISQDTCKVMSESPNTVKTITRTLNDEIAIAQSQGIAVSVVVPFNVQARYTTQQSYEAAMNQLEYLAKATGGKYIYYNQATAYNENLLTDTLYQIFGHTPKTLVLAYKDALDSQGSFQTGHVLGASTDQPVILDASQSSTPFAEYKWDFNNDGQWDETSPGPVVQHEFTSPQSGFVRVAGADSHDVVQSETRIAFAAAESTELPASPTLPTVPQVTAILKTNGDISLTWQSEEQGSLVAIDPASHLPVVEAPLSKGSVIFTPEQAYTQLEIRVITQDAISDPVTVTVTLEVSVDTEPTPPIQPQPDPTLCYKLQQCQNESAPPDSYNPRGVSSSPVEPTIQPPKVTAAQQTRKPISVTTVSQPSVQGVETTNIPPTKNKSPINETPAAHSSQKNKYYWIIILIILGMLAILIRSKKRRRF